MLFLNLIIIKLCILHKYHLPSSCGSAGIWYSTCLEMPRIAKFRTYFCKKNSGGGPTDDPDPTFNTTFLYFFFFVAPYPLFGAKLRHWYIQILQIWMTPHNITLFEFISVPYENQHQTLNIKKIDRGQIRLREYLFTHTCQTAGLPRGGGDSPFTPLDGGGVRKLPICFIFSSYRSIYDNKKVDKAFLYL